MLLSILKEQFTPAVILFYVKHMSKWHVNLFHSLFYYFSCYPILLFFILFILLATTSGVTINYLNLSPSVPLNFVSGTGNELVSSLVNTELKYIFNASAIKIPVLLHSQHCPPVVHLYLEHSAYFLHTHRNVYCLILCFEPVFAQNFA